MTQRGTYIATASPLPVFLGTCTPCLRPNRVRSEEARGDTLVASCPDCGAPTRLQRLYGTVTRMECDPRCMGATGPCCSCGCAGTNHGGAFAESGEMLADALKRYRDAQAVKAAAATARADARQRAERTAFSEWYDEANADGDLDWLAGTDWYGVDDFLGELAERVTDGKMLSPRQLACVPRNRARYERREAERAERDANATEVPAGRQEVAGVVLATRTEDSPFGYNRMVTKVLVDAGTFRVWGTLPAAIGYADKGDRVKFTATLAAKPGEVGFGFFSRPTKAEFIPPAEGSGPDTDTCDACQRPIWKTSCGRWFHRATAAEACSTSRTSFARPAKPAEAPARPKDDAVGFAAAGA
jgi:hypothetical protein